MQTSSKEGKKVLLRVSNLKQYFPLKKKGLFVKANDGITLDIYEGETFGLVGESGCGKSTLGRTLLQLYRQTDGRTMYYGRTLDDLAPAYVKKTLQTLDKRREKWHELKKHLANVQKEYDALPDGEAKYKKHNELDKAVKDENDALLDMANLIGGFVCVKDVHPAQKLFLEEYRISSARVKEMNRRAAVHFLYAGAGNAVFLQEQLLRGMNVLHADEAANEVRHIQQRVVLVLDSLVQFVVLLVLRLAVRQRVVFLLHVGQMLFQLVPLFAALVERLQRLFDVSWGEIVQRAAVIHRPAVRLAIELEQRAAQRGLAAAALADQAKGFALVDIQRNAVVGLDEKALLFQREVLLEVADAKQHLLPLFT